MRKLMLTACLILVALPAAADWDKATFEASFAETYEIEAAIALCREVIESTEDLDLIRGAQEKWESLDGAGVREYFAAYRQERPGSAQAVYLLGRLAEDPLEAIRLGRETLALDSEEPHGYQLIIASYAQHLFDSSKPSAEIQAAFIEDEAIFARYFELKAGDPGALYHQLNYRLHKGDIAGARESCAAGKAAGARWAGDRELARIEAAAGNLAGVKSHVAAYIDAYVSAGQIEPGDRDGYVNQFVSRTLRGAGAFEMLLAEQEAQEPSEEGRAAQLYDLACTLALMGRGESAITQLQAAVDAGFADPGTLSTDEDLLSLHDDPVWSSISKAVEDAHAAGTDERRSAALADGFERPAPGWTLRAAAGGELSLADLKGQVVILDFWATWCSPCRMAMPVIDEWMKNDMPEGVRVFSVNVWEKTPAGARAFLLEHDYAMELLYGSDELAGEYGVKGIPYICAIDREGRIRFEEKGYSPELGEKLAIWAEALLK
jgi:cytochrome c biogenesis protein CcmG, thiol:disulfide interchange protein DsbE